MKNTILLAAFLIFTLTNTNAQWEKLNFTSQYTYAIEMYDNTMYIGAYNGVYRSKDQGQHWGLFMNGIISSYGDTQVYSFKDIEGNYYLCCSDGAYRLSQDQSKWEVFCDKPATLSLIKTNNEFIIGTWGNSIYRSTDNGSSWTNEWEQNQEIFDFKSLIEWNDDLYTATSHGIFKSNNIGRTWERIDSAYTTSLELFDNKLYAASINGILQKDQSNDKWINLGLGYYNPQDINIYNGKIFSTTNLGFYVKTSKSDRWLPAQRGADGVGEQQAVQTLISGDKIYLLTVKSLWVRDLSGYDLPVLSVNDVLYENNEFHVGEEFYINAGYANNGFDTLYVEDITWDNPEFEIYPRNFILEPDAGLGLIVKVKGKNPGWIKTNCTIISNDAINKNTFTIRTRVLPLEYTLSQNYPNPFNPETKIEFYVEKEEFVTLKIFNILGKEIKTVVNEIMPGGIHDVTVECSDLSSGVYFYVLTSGNFSATKKMILLR